ncbi:MAG TPA: class I tRNA ligase family protein, partial [Rhabdochlamydiaceae bacterium]
LRMYMMFMGPPELDCEWQDAGLEGIKRFLNRLWHYFFDAGTIVSEEKVSQESKQRFHQLLKEYQERIALFKPNTAISSLMEWLNDVTAQDMTLSLAMLEDFVVSLSVLAPHMASELLEQLVHKKLENCTWPSYDPALAKQTMVTIAIQVNGKLRATIQASADAKQADIESLAKMAAGQWLSDKEIVKTIFVPGKLISFVVK